MTISMTTHEAEIIEFLKPFSKDDQRVLELLAMSLGRVLNRAAKAGDDWRFLCSAAQARHIADWIVVDVKADAEWLQNTDDLGRAKKLLKFANVSQITQEADKAMLKANQRLGSIKLVDGDEEFFDHLSDGYYLVKLKTPAALDRESAVMQHCVGQGAYDNELVKEGFMILSMRDPYGKPHATLEINGFISIYQIQGKQNTIPRRDYLDKIIDYFAVKNGDKYLDLSGALSDHKMVLSKDNELMDMMNLPNNFSSKSDLNLGNINGARLPKGLHVNGSLNCTDSEIARIHDIHVEESVMLQSMQKLKSIGKIKVGKNLTVNHCPEFATLPENLKVPGSLVLTNSPKLKKLPAGLEVGEVLNLYGTSITKLPDDIKIGRKLITKGTKINLEELPASLPDSLVIQYSPFEEDITLGKIRKAAKRRQKKVAMEAEQFLGTRM